MGLNPYLFSRAVLSPATRVAAMLVGKRELSWQLPDVLRPRVQADKWKEQDFLGRGMADSGLRVIVMKID